jgi:RNA polymerase sigma-70 factor, ECF subfamily
VTAPDDDELMARVQRRDQAAFDRLVHRHLTSVHRYLGRMTGSPADADELSQETFLRVWQRAGSYTPGKVRLTTWMHRIAHNLAVDRLRRRPGDLYDPDVEPDDPGSDPQTLAENAETRRLLHAAMARLPANQRAALLLCQVQGFSNRDAASILAVTVRGLESLIARARRTLRQTLLNAEGDDNTAMNPEQEDSDHDTA